MLCVAIVCFGSLPLFVHSRSLFWCSLVLLSCKDEEKGDMEIEDKRIEDKEIEDNNRLQLNKF